MSQAPAVETIDVKAVNKKENRSLYKKREKIFPKRVAGTFRRLKWLVMSLCLAIYYLTPWLRWDRGEGAPDQAILLDMANRRFYFFFIELWPQEIYFLTGILVLSALALFLFTALFGRVWCGYACPQTVWTDVFIHVERWIEGDRGARMRLEKSGWTFDKLRKRVIKHILWVLIAIVTGGAWVFYFVDAPTLMVELFTLQAGLLTYIFIGIFSATTYLLGGIAREQVCTYMCPWPRIQAAMMDHESMVVSYRGNRGEPRGKATRKGVSREDAGLGDCIDCNQCVAVCPMGIDIRDGLQLECIGCALCVDACDNVMEKTGSRRGLIDYVTEANLETGAQDRPVKPQFIRTRTVLYSTLIAVVSAIMLFALLTRVDGDINVLRDRNPLFVPLSDGSIRNSYTVKLFNKKHERRVFRLSVEGLDGADVAIVGAFGVPNVEVDPAKVEAHRMVVVAPGKSVRESTDIVIVATDIFTGQRFENGTTFKGPRGRR